MKMRLASLTCLCLLAACGSGSGGPAVNANASNGQEPDPQPPGPQPPTHEHLVSGEVFSFDTGMIGNADVNLFVYTPGFGYSYWWANGRLQTDELGLFEADVPTSDLSFLVIKDGFVQPCGFRATATQDIQVRIEMLPVSAFNTLHAPRPQTSFEPSITGVVFENTANGRVAIDDVHLWAEDYLGIGRARTRSDLSGGIYMCNLPKDTYLYFGKSGYESVWVGPIDPTQPLVLEVEMKRETP